MIKNLRLVLLFVLINTTLTFSQITITQSDYNSYFSVGISTNDFGDTNEVSVNIGQLGGNNNWDFSTYAPDLSYTVNFINPVNTPYSNLFPSANLVSYFTRNFSVDDTTTINSESWTYFTTGSNSVKNGMVLENTSTTPNTQSVFRNETIHYPPFDEYEFPIEFNKAWTATDSTERETFVDGVSTGFISVSSSVHNFTVDAWGTMTLPGGNSYPALRLREVQTSTSYINGFPISTFTTGTYFFLAKTGEAFTVQTENPNPPTSGSITGTIGWSSRSVTGVDEQIDAVPTNFQLSQNFPNPFNPSTTIQYSVSNSSFVDLKIYDSIGNEIKSLVSANRESGTYKVSWNGLNENNIPVSSGVYFYKLKANDMIDIKKMILLR